MATLKSIGGKILHLPSKLAFKLAMSSCSSGGDCKGCAMCHQREVVGELDDSYERISPNIWVKKRTEPKE